jgi:sortase (surface protein transpeptidase)
VRERAAAAQARRRRRALTAAIGALAAAAVAASVVFAIAQLSAAPAAPAQASPTGVVDADTGAAIGAVPEPSPGQGATSTSSDGSAPIAGQPLHLQIPSIGLDVNVGRMTVPAGGTVDPPTMGSAYWLAEYGVVGASSTNTAYIAGHTCRGACHSAFSPMLDVPKSETRVHSGDEVLVTTPQGVDHYTVTDTVLYTKTTIQQQTELWKKVPGRLVLVTCFQYAGGTSSQQNFVVYAQLDSGQP